MTAEIMEVELQRRYPDDCALPLVPDNKIYVGHLKNKKRAGAIIEFDDHISSSGRIGCKALYREKYTGELKTCFRENSVGFKPYQDVVWLKGGFPEVVDTTYFPYEKHIKNNYSAFKRAFKEASENI